LETALTDLHTGGKRILYPSEFTEGEASIPINGLIWMGKPDFMWQQIEEKVNAGFNCMKLKIGAIDFETELSILKKIRDQYGSDIELRVDANGAFTSDNVWYKLEELSKLDIHSIEQPVMAGQAELMQEICRNSPVPVALVEELIGVIDEEEKAELIEFIKPQYLILKPSLLGGFEMCEEWIEIAEENGAGWWVTSALEGNIGLNAIAQWTYELENPLPQGLGTGQVFSNNIKSPLTVKQGELWYDVNAGWEDPFL
jgi:L-alanine-DL-glutamate epimerase-like enolase superfamily enzyme